MVAAPVPEVPTGTWETIFAPASSNFAAGVEGAAPAVAVGAFWIHPLMVTLLAFAAGC